MPEHTIGSADECGNELRRILAARRERYRRVMILAVTAIAIVPVLGTLALRSPVVLLWNASASAPRGLYRVRAGEEPHRGNMAIAWLPQAARQLAARRHYLPANVPLVTRVAAEAGDLVCAAGLRVAVNGRFAALRKRWDARGRPLPTWSGCRRLQRGEL